MHFIKFCFAFYLADIIASILYVYDTQDKIVWWVYWATNIAIALLSLICVVVFPIYGCRMQQVLVKMGGVSSRRIRNISMIAFISTLYFLLRSLAHMITIAVVGCKEVHYEQQAQDALKEWQERMITIKYVAETTLLLLLLLALPWKPAPSKRGYQPIMGQEHNYVRAILLHHNQV